MDTFQIAAELKIELEDYGVVFPYDPYGAINLEEVIAEFLKKHFKYATDAAYDDGYDSGYDNGFDRGYDEAEEEYS
jgi:hypothetical protein